jgi:hypothetical protein
MDLAAPGRDTALMEQATAGLDRPLRLGDMIRLSFQANRSCHVTLLDVGTSGNVVVIRPNAWCSRTSVEGGQRLYLPGIEIPEFDFVLTGRAGRERIVAIASTEPLGMLLLPESEAPFRALTAEEIGRIAEGLSRSSTEWVITRCEFDIET